LESAGRTCDGPISLPENRFRLERKTRRDEADSTN
jgi:hypothetical protein